MKNKTLLTAIALSLGLAVSACSPRHETLCLGNTIRSCEPSIYFACNSTKMDRNAKQNLDWIAQKVQKYPDRTVYITGYADLDSESRNNKELSLRRAETIRAELKTRGVPGSQIKIRGLGQANPRTYDLEKQEINRRADITFGHVPHEYVLTCNDE